MCTSAVMVSTSCFTVVALLTLISVATSSGEWKERNGLYYYVGSTTVEAASTWYTARNWCLNQGGDLTSVTSPQQYDDVIYVIEQNKGQYNGPLWIGLNRLGSADWRFSDGLQTSTFYWAPGQPVNETNLVPLLCVHTLSTAGNIGLWYTSHCDTLASFVCQRNPGATSPSSPLSTVTTPVNGYCPFGYTAVGAKCFKIFNGADGGSTWSEAAALCRSEPGLNADLASISNVHENNAILVLLRDQKLALWIGLRKLSATETRWVWADNSPFGYSNWATGEPSFSNTELCTEVWTMTLAPATWNNADCPTKRGYICQTYPVPGATLPPTTPNTVCPVGYMFYWFSCYKLHEELKTWSDAAAACSAEVAGASLVSVHSPSENAFLQMYNLDSTHGSSRIWIGLSYQEEFNYYYWNDNWHVTFTKWASGQPVRSPQGGGCVSIDSTSALWYDQLCNEAKPFICWKPVQDAPARTTPLPTDGECPPNSPLLTWVARGSYCYAASITTRNWQMAEDFCRTEGGPQSHLTSIHDPMEKHFIGDLIRARSPYSGAYWIGLTKEADDTFQWTDGSVIDYTNWVGDRPPEATSGVRYCGKSLLRDYIDQWDRNVCTDYFPCVCQAPIVPRPTPPPPINGSCPSSNWIAYGDMCFLFEPDHWLTMDEAGDECMKVGSNLATIRSLEESIFVQSQVNDASKLSFSRSYWIGLHKPAGSMEFSWFDDPEANFTNWETNNPISSNQTRLCVDINGNKRLNYQAKWTTENCTEINGFVCSTRKTLSPSGPTEPASHGDNGSKAGTAAGVVIAVLIILALLGAGIFYYVTKVRIHRQATNAGVTNFSYDNGTDEVDSKPADSQDGIYTQARAPVSNGRTGPVGAVTGGDVIYDNFDDLASYDAEIDRRLSSVRVGRLSFEP